MKQTAWKIAMLTGLIGSFLATGCCERQEGEIQLLQQDKGRLQATIGERDGVIIRMQEDARAMDNEIKAKNRMLVEKDRQIASLQSQAGQPKTVEDGWTVGKYGDQVTLGSDILFSSGRATLTKSGQAALSRLAGDLKGRYRGLPVRVYGYTDSDPIRKSKKFWADNLDLSSNRAMAVTRYLIKRGISAERIATIGMGATKFVTSNKSKTGKAKNRRVEILVVKPPK